ncbi:MAG: PLP-dependent aminotransferase family protein [Ruthenibacterium sp.]
MESIVLQESRSPLYQQVYAKLTAEIQSGALAAGEKLPAKRRLAADLHISLNTVDTAYQMLAAEGYVTAKPRSGFYVCRIERLTPQLFAPAAPVCAAPAPCYAYDFETASIDTALFPFKTWRRLGRDAAASPALLNHGARQGDANLRAAIATYLHEYRGARCSAAQIVVGAGIEYLLGMLARMFHTAVFAVENPGYARTHRILENNGAAVRFVPVDESGLCDAALAASGATLAYVTPSHQFPTGVTMPIGRRIALLQWAKRTGGYLIEDDYDSEFRFDGKPLASLQGLDDSGHVIYISTFSKSIAPAIRIGYMVLPTALLALFEQEFGFYSSTVSRFEQQTLCRFMEGGYFARHLARLRNAYRIRRDVLASALIAAFGRENCTITGAHTGLHLLFRLRTADSEAALVQKAAAYGVHLNGLSAYYAADTAAACPPRTVVLGYAGLSETQITQAVAALKLAWECKKDD